MEVAHTPTHAAQTRPDHLFVWYQMTGGIFVVQNGREVTIEAGTLTLIDPMLPYDCKLFESSKTLLIKVPRLELRARLGRNREIVARLVTPARVDDRLMLMLTSTLPSLAGTMSSAAEEMVSNHAIDLIGLSLARTMESSAVRLSSPRSVLLSHIRAVIEAKLTDPDLDAQEVADAVGISVRYANDLLAQHDTSIRRLVLARRLARCRYALEDSNQAHRSVSEIAYGWGFSDPTHFGRRFKEAYGVSPGEYRSLARQSGQGCRAR